MAWPGILPDPHGPVIEAGIRMPTPGRRGFFWFEGFLAPMDPEDLYVNDLPIIYRVADTEYGWATYGAGFTPEGYLGIQVEIGLEGVWDVVLVDSFGGADCLPAPRWVVGERFERDPNPGCAPSARSISAGVFVRGTRKGCEP